jgi:hypothetical protein
MGVLVSDFGERDGVHTHRINGEKEELEKIIREIRAEGGEFAVEPNIQKSHGHYTILLKTKIKKAKTG